MTQAPSPTWSRHSASRLLTLAADIKLHHSVFALPFALLAMFLAGAQRGELPSWSELTLIVACMVLARTYAMALNRAVDARLDAANPRTAGRAIPAGRLSVGYVATVAGLCALLFIAATSGFYFLKQNPWPLALAPVALAWLGFYSWTKRFTAWCHLVLGVALALSVPAAALAIAPAFLARPDVYLLAGMVACWVAAFDIIYALQDVEVDRSQSLHSLPASLGIEPALWISRILHGACVALLAILGLVNARLGLLFGIGIVILAGLLLLEHGLIWRDRRQHRINHAFFTINGIISLALGALGVMDVVLAR